MHYLLPLLLCLLILPCGGWAQPPRQHLSTPQQMLTEHTVPPRDTLRLVSYNVENLFDCLDDTLKADDEYLPYGKRRWSPKRYRRKLNEVAKVLLALSQEGEAPPLVALYEVENEQVLHDLTRQTPLCHADYRILITSSADVRGIDVALLYRPDLFRILSSRPLRANLPGQRPTRDVLHVSGLLSPALHDTLDLFLLHLPSRMSGTHVTEPYRCHVAQAVRHALDSLTQLRQRPCFLLMGDFNEGPRGKALTQVLRARAMEASPQRVYAQAERNTQAQRSADVRLQDTALYQLLSPRRPSSLRSIQGSYKFQGHWELIDHLLASGALLQQPMPRAQQVMPGQRQAAEQQSMPRLRLLPSTAQVAPLPFLLTDDRLYGGQCPQRTYYGSTYLGGPSDHLPLIVDFVISSHSEQCVNPEW